jgi:hypothetical protein
VASNRPTTKTTSKPPVVEEIPETTSPSVASNRPRSNSPVVENINETNNSNANGPDRGTNNSSSNNKGKEKLPPGLKRDKNGKLQPKDGWIWVNPNDPSDTRVQRDPNKPDIWTQLGGAVRAAVTGQPPPGVTNNPSTTSNPGGGGGGGQGLNLAGTWNVTTRSTGEDDPTLNQNWTRTTVWQVWNLGGGRWRVRQTINGQTYDENYSTVDDGGGRFRLVGSNPDGSTYEMSGTYNQSQFSVATSGGQNRIAISGTRQ